MPRAVIVAALLFATSSPAWADPQVPDALLEPGAGQLRQLLDRHARSSADSEAVLHAVEMKLYGLFAAAPSGGLMADYVRAQWNALADLEDAAQRSRGANILTDACDAAYRRTLTLEANIPVEVCDWTRDAARREAMIGSRQVVP